MLFGRPRLFQIVSYANPLRHWTSFTPVLSSVHKGCKRQRERKRINESGKVNWLFIPSLFHFFTFSLFCPSWDNSDHGNGSHDFLIGTVPVIICVPCSTILACIMFERNEKCNLRQRAILSLIIVARKPTCRISRYKKVVIVWIIQEKALPLQHRNKLKTDEYEKECLAMDADGCTDAEPQHEFHSLLRRWRQEGWAAFPVESSATMNVIYFTQDNIPNASVVYDPNNWMKKGSHTASFFVCVGYDTNLTGWNPFAGIYRQTKRKTSRCQQWQEWRKSKDAHTPRFLASQANKFESWGDTPSASLTEAQNTDCLGKK